MSTVTSSWQHGGIILPILAPILQDELKQVNTETLQVFSDRIARVRGIPVRYPLLSSFIHNFAST